jgi:DNA-binding NarL/FixJ family response regulator
MTGAGAMIAGVPGVLVVDDDPAFRGLARRLLAAEGLAVVGEADGVATGLAAARRLRPDGALVDMRLGDGDGIALARDLLALPWHPRVILTSTHPDAASADDVRRCGAGGFFPKDELPDAPLKLLFTRP